MVGKNRERESKFCQCRDRIVIVNGRSMYSIVRWKNRSKAEDFIVVSIVVLTIFIPAYQNALPIVA